MPVATEWVFSRSSLDSQTVLKAIRGKKISQRSNNCATQWVMTHQGQAQCPFDRLTPFHHRYVLNPKQCGERQRQRNLAPSADIITLMLGS